MAHMKLDGGTFDLDHMLPGSWLGGPTGSGNEQLDLQFHIAVFEPEFGLWDAVLARFVGHLLPVAAITDEALTDERAIAWRLALTSDSADVCFGEPLRAAAARRLTHRDDPHVELLRVPAFARVGDVDRLDRRFRSRGRRARGRKDRLVPQLGRALRSFAVEDSVYPAAGPSEVVASIREIGGSRAQYQLFEQIEPTVWRRIHSPGGAGRRRVCRLRDRRRSPDRLPPVSWPASSCRPLRLCAFAPKLRLGERLRSKSRDEPSDGMRRITGCRRLVVDSGLGRWPLSSTAREACSRLTPGRCTGRTSRWISTSRGASGLRRRR